MEGLFTIIQNKFLLRALKNCDEKGVENALRRGANPNIMIPVGTYYDGIVQHEPCWRGMVSVHPVVFMANLASKQPNNEETQKPYQQIIDMFINHPKTNLNVAVSENVKYWYEDDYELNDFPPDETYTDTHTIKGVIAEVSSCIKNDFILPRPGLYMMRPSMMAHIQRAVNKRQKSDQLTQAEKARQAQLQKDHKYVGER